MIWGPQSTQDPATGQRQTVLLRCSGFSWGHRRAGGVKPQTGFTSMQVPRPATSQLRKADLALLQSVWKQRPLSVAHTTHTIEHGSPTTSSPRRPNSVSTPRLSSLPKNCCSFSYQKEHKFFQIDLQPSLGLVNMSVPWISPREWNSGLRAIIVSSHTSPRMSRWDSPW